MNNADYAEHLRSIASLHMKLLPEAGESRTLCGVTLHRRDESNCAATCSAHPGMGLLVQGAKRALMGGKTVEYTAGECLVVGVDMLDSFQAIGATHETPFLGVSFDLEEDEVVKITSEMDACGIPIPKRADAEDLSGAAWIMQPDIKVIDAYAKLVELFETLEEAPILAPLIRREIIFRFLVSQGGAAFRQIFTVGAPEYRIRKAAFEIRKNLRNSIDFRELAKSIGMSQPTFYRYFREVTGQSPLQYQKSLKLQEARRAILSGLPVAQTGYEFGYESPAQFSRDYRSQFGLSPRGDFEQFRKGEAFWRKNAANGSWPESLEEAQKNTYRAIS